MALLIGDIGFDLFGRDPWCVGREVGQVDLPDRKGGELAVAQDGDVDLAPVDVLFRDGVGSEFLVDELDPLAQLLIAGDH